MTIARFFFLFICAVSCTGQEKKHKLFIRDAHIKISQDHAFLIAKDTHVVHRKNYISLPSYSAIHKVVFLSNDHNITHSTSTWMLKGVKQEDAAFHLISYVDGKPKCMASSGGHNHFIFLLDCDTTRKDQMWTPFWSEQLHLYMFMHASYGRCLASANANNGNALKNIVLENCNSTSPNQKFKVVVVA
jgi:hypothetical protein